MNAPTLRSHVPLKAPQRFYIDGEWVSPLSGETIDVVSPATEELYVRVGAANVADIERAVTAARRAFDSGPWPRMSHAERATYLTAIARALEARAGDVGAIWPNEMGILHSLASAYAGGVAGLYDMYAAMAPTFPFEERHTPTSGGNVALLVREAVGVVGAIIPWNAPVMLIAMKIAPALLAGCTVVVKASPEAPGHALIMAEIAEHVGLPPGVINVLTADREASAALVRHPGIDKIAFTGSTATGKAIAATLGGRMARYTMELGGKSAAVILEDFDVGTAAAALAGTACTLTGQVCAALTRIIVPKSRHDEMVEALAAGFASIQVGDPFDPASQMGPLASRRQRDRVESYIAKGRDEGFRIATGGGRPAALNRGFFVEPTVFANVSNDATIAREEIFGPVLSVIPASSEAEAIAIANDSDFGLNASVFTNDADRAYAAARQLRSGTVGHNAMRADFGIAFGGFKQSGVGREGGVEGLLPYLETKTVILDGLPKHLGR